MRSVLRRIWILPWPQSVRHAALAVITLPGIRLAIFPHFMVGVVGLIVNDRREILLVRHTYRRQYPWGLPTGFLEHGEQPLPALHREIGEETGFQVDIDPAPRVYTSSDRPIVNVVFAGRYVSGSFAATSETTAADFFSLSSLPALEPGQAALLRAWTPEEAP
jgi:ADP-ribose pyrophosphatase YjhB (NUDIX family)